MRNIVTEQMINDAQNGIKTYEAGINKVVVDKYTTYDYNYSNGEKYRLSFYKNGESLDFTKFHTFETKNTKKVVKSINNFLNNI